MNWWCVLSLKEDPARSGAFLGGANLLGMAHQETFESKPSCHPSRGSGASSWGEILQFSVCSAVVARNWIRERRPRCKGCVWYTQLASPAAVLLRFRSQDRRTAS